MLKFVLKNPNELKMTMALNGLSIRGFSKEIGVSHSFLSQVINGKRNPSATTAKRIAAGLQKDIGDFFLVLVVDELPFEGGESCFQQKLK
ncbi:helix-turn-helix transcriptional regulator [Lysinibacillus sp.]|uniref:helix-turn-helix domain-containing protein n=1 Tax=Lysinibacillus sp. TaxID=1869345 RepID=UPI0028B0DAFE|nr:helix-turn-helix transcriptional regulator [Lysinibacillus sp.]